MIVGLEGYTLININIILSFKVIYISSEDGCGKKEEDTCNCKTPYLQYFIMQNLMCYIPNLSNVLHSKSI